MNIEDLNVVILAYARPDTFKEVVESCQAHLKKVKIVMDYPESDSISARQDEIVQIINNLEMNCTLVRREENYGLVKSVLTTVSTELNNNDHVVLLEDDCVPGKEFFEFVCHSLVKYRDNHDISTICGTVTDCKFNPWGWATWSHKWKYNHMPVEEILKISNLDENLKIFLTNNTVEDSIWSLSWLAHQYKNNCTSIYPKQTLIKNIGVDDSGVHSAEKGYTRWLLSQIKKS